MAGGVPGGARHGTKRLKVVSGVPCPTMGSKARQGVHKAVGEGGRQGGRQRGRACKIKAQQECHKGARAIHRKAQW